MGYVVLVNPADMNLADAKATAAEYDATIEASEYVQRGQVVLIPIKVVEDRRRFR